MDTLGKLGCFCGLVPLASLSFLGHESFHIFIYRVHLSTYCCVCLSLHAHGGAVIMVPHLFWTHVSNYSSSWHFHLSHHPGSYQYVSGLSVPWGTYRFLLYHPFTLICIYHLPTPSSCYHSTSSNRFTQVSISLLPLVRLVRLSLHLSIYVSV